MRPEEVRRAFAARYGGRPKLASAPGRVNLIGEHTDYNEGFVLPVAIDRYCVVAFAPNQEKKLRGYSLLDSEERAVPLDELSRSGSWFDYPAGVVLVHREEGLELSGMDFVVGGDVPVGAGLSSSAAFELAVARAVVELSGGTWDGARAARLAQRAENEVVGVPCGLMDPMAASLSREGAAMLLDCRSLAFEHVPLPDGLAVVVMDTGTRRTLKDSSYEERRKSCETAAAVLGVAALRDATRELLGSHRHRLGETVYRRARHVVEENERTRAMGDALAEGDETRIGDFMRASHESLRDLFEVSSPALDAIVEAASARPECVGARMTGGGFAGCAVALVRASAVDRFAREVEAGYQAATGYPGRLYPCRAVGGARILG